MTRRTVRIAMNGVTGRMGYRQHLVRSILAIREQGGVQVPDGPPIWPEPLLVGRSETKLSALAEKLSPAHAEIVWAMAVTGIGPSELWGRWQVLPDRVHIAGTKRAGRVRDVPLLWPLAPPARAYQAFRRALSRASGEAISR